MTAVPPPADVPAPPERDLSAASDAARDRIAEAFPEAVPPGAPAEAAPPPTDADASGPEIDLLGDAEPDLPFDDLSYRDGKRLAGEIQRARERFKPLNDAFGTMSDDARAQLLAAAPTLGDDLAVLGRAGSTLHPDDRRFFADAMSLMSTDPERAAEALAYGAQALRDGLAARGQGAPAQPTAVGAPAADDGELPDWAIGPDGEPLPEGQRPVTMDDLDKLLKDRDYQEEVRAAEDDIRRQAKDLGYDPDATEGVDRARFVALVDMAGQPSVGGDLGKAHEILGTWEQSVIDNFVAGKSADADRPGAPVTGGAPPAEPRRLETLEDARQASVDRLAAVLGPDPRARRSED